ncbi:Asp23/Gls24 family envelope stress response protein, partial [Nocardia farcinica]|uniref:Asp23/Gls24 family envelope stress response protein n=1 Tax=Nocardia farcinica TaxID=37329 RepID=UPI0018957D68
LARADGVRVRRTNDGGVRVAVDLVVTADADVAAVGRAVQREITRVVAEQTGEDVGEVAVLVLDIEPEAR